MSTEILKCSINDGRITLCKELDTLFKKHDSKIEKVTVVIMNDIQDEFIGQVSFKYGRKKKEIVALSFCPFCGGNLR